MAERWQAAVHCPLPNQFITPCCRSSFQLCDTCRQVGDRAEVPGTIKCHLTRSEQIRDRLGMKTCKIPRDHVRTCGTMMDLDRAKILQNSGFRRADASPQKQAEYRAKWIRAFEGDKKCLRL